MSFKIKLFSLLVFLPLFAFCQDPASSSPSKFSLGIVLSPDFDYRYLKASKSPNYYPADQIVAQRNGYEIPKLGFTGGLSLLYQLNTKITFETGILFSDKGEETKNFPFPSTPPDQIQSFSMAHHYQYFDIPLLADYYFTRGKLKFFVSGGLSANMFQREKTVTTITYTDGSKRTGSESERGYSFINLAAQAGLGLRWDITNKLMLSVQPVYQQSILSIIDTPVKSYLWSAGCNIGMYYQF